MLGLVFGAPLPTFASEAGRPDAAAADGDPQEAAAEVEAARTEEKAALLDLVTVRASPLSYHYGQTYLTREDIERLAGGDGDLNLLLRTLPNVQFGEDLYDVRRLGEIEPAKVSISGGRFYENSFSVDGVSTSSLLDPAGSTSLTAIDDAPGYAQSQFFDTELIESLEIYDANAPARFGGFTGGVVAAETRSAADSFRGTFFVSGTSDSLVNFKVFPPELDPEEPEPVEIVDPPQYRKYRYGGQLDIPLTDDAGLLLSATQLESSIPELSLAEFRNRERSNTNLLANLNLPLGDWDLRANVNATPYSSQNFITDALNSDFEIKGGGYGGSLHLDGLSPLGDTELRLSYSASTNDREAPRNFFNWATSSNGPDWGESIFSLTSREGGFGDLDKGQDNLAMSGSIFTRLGPGNLNLGLSLERVGADFRRAEDLYVFRSAVLDNRIRCIGENVSACIEGNQALFTRSVYPAEDVSVDLLQSGAYAEWDWQGLEFGARVGVRADYDDFQRNLNVAPRLMATYQPWSWLGMHLGANRYYSRALLTYRLREARVPFFSETREATGATIGGQPVLLITDDWQRAAASGGLVYEGSVSDLRTPYADELAGGFSFPLVGGTGGLRGVLRESRDEFSQSRSAVDPETGLVTVRPANEGRSSYRSVTFLWEGQLGPVDLGLNVTWSQNERTNAEYDSRSASEFDDEQVIYESEILRRGDLLILADDFSRPLVANLTLSLPRRWGTEFSMTGRYRQRFKSISDTGRTQEVVLQECPDCPAVDVSLPVYADRTRPATILFDARLNVDLPQLGRHGGEAELLLSNLFDSRTYTAEGANAYEAGISAWVLFRYRYR